MILHDATGFKTSQSRNFDERNTAKCELTMTAAVTIIWGLVRRSWALRLQEGNLEEHPDVYVSPSGTFKRLVAPNHEVGMRVQSLWKSGWRLRAGDKARIYINALIRSEKIEKKEKVKERKRKRKESKWIERQKETDRKRIGRGRQIGEMDRSHNSAENQHKNATAIGYHAGNVIGRLLDLSLSVYNAHATRNRVFRSRDLPPF